MLANLLFASALAVQVQHQPVHQAARLLVVGLLQLREGHRARRDGAQGRENSRA